MLKDCSPFLLLNIAAIGSLYIGTHDAIGKVSNNTMVVCFSGETTNALLQGEALWRLAQVAAATSVSDTAHRTWK